MISFCPAISSYLGYPRIHFAGQFRADVNFINNRRCAFCSKKNYNSTFKSMQGTNEFEFIQSIVTSVVYSDGRLSTEDNLVGHDIITNLARPLAKIITLDHESKIRSSIYGMKFGICWKNTRSTDESNSSSNNNVDSNIAFYGNWSANVLDYYIWNGVQCLSHSHPKYKDKFGQASAQATTTITDIKWGKLGNSKILAQMRSASEAAGGNLSIRVTVYGYNYTETEETLGYVVGVIGVPSPLDTLNSPGERTMFETGHTPRDLKHKNCNTLPWIYLSPFEVDEGKGEIRIDLSNSIPFQNPYQLLYIGTLSLGYIPKDSNCIYLLGGEEGDIPYSTMDYLINSGIHTIKFNSYEKSMVMNSPLVLVQVVHSIYGGSAPICGKNLFQHSSTAQILLKENMFFIRPKGFFADRLDRIVKPFTTKTLFVTHYGLPAKDVAVEIKRLNFLNEDSVVPPQPLLPENGVVPTSWQGTTDKDGLVTFQFHLHDLIPMERQYVDPGCGKDQCTFHSDPKKLPIDGQLYTFSFCVKSNPGAKCKNSLFGYNVIAILAFSDIYYTPPYTWVDHVSPIFSIYARVSPVMHSVLDMTSYKDVTKLHTIEILKRSLSLGINDPSHMPVNRNLSPTKRSMILQWLDNPLYDKFGYESSQEKTPFLCNSTTFSFSSRSQNLNSRCSEERLLHIQDHPQNGLPHLKEIFKPDYLRRENEKCLHQGSAAGVHVGYNFSITERPLIGHVRPQSNPFGNTFQPKMCSKSNLMVQLQTAMALEWSTLPIYLTSLYSIVDGCNVEIHDIIYSVVMQEMLHFILAANMLIALNGTPRIDDASFTPSYPDYLPGCVLPSLKVNIEKLSLEHISAVFMSLEVPQATEVAGEMYHDWFTIGTFYEEIHDCIEFLRFTAEPGEDIFNASTISRQVKWPSWNKDSDVGALIPIVGTDSALRAVNIIVSQGEGASLDNPFDVDTRSLAHFFKFEEIVCQRHLKRFNKVHYAYNGSTIRFNPSGVAPMRNNPRISTIKPNTDCYVESRAFHKVYRNLLRKLQEVFNGEPDEIFTAIELMDSLKVHAKRLMWTKFNPFDPQDKRTCGPIWEYKWPGSHKSTKTI